MSLKYKNLKIGDILYEFSSTYGIKSEIITKPKYKNKKRSWKSKNTKTGKEINYLVTEGLEHYGPKLYDYEAYNVSEYI